MGTQKAEKIQQLRGSVPHGYLTTKAALRSADFSLHQIDNFVKSAQLETVTSGVYKLPGTKLHWEGVIASLQKLGLDITVGGLTALDLSGFGHYLELGEQKTVYLSAADTLPAWVHRVLPEISLEPKKRSSLLRLNEVKNNFFKIATSSMASEIEFSISQPELAILEFLQYVPQQVSFEHADLIMEGLNTLSPRRLDPIIKSCKNVKAKRLFFWLARRHNHAWLKSVNYKQYDLGSGKRVLAPQGKLDNKFLITVPKDMHAAPE